MNTKKIIHNYGPDAMKLWRFGNLDKVMSFISLHLCDNIAR